MLSILAHHVSITGMATWIGMLSLTSAVAFMYSDLRRMRKQLVKTAPQRDERVDIHEDMHVKSIQSLLNMNASLGQHDLIARQFNSILMEFIKDHLKLEQRVSELNTRVRLREGQLDIIQEAIQEAPAIAIFYNRRLAKFKADFKAELESRGVPIPPELETNED